MLARLLRLRLLSWSLSGCSGTNSTFRMFSSRRPVDPERRRSKQDLIDQYEEDDLSEPEEKFQEALREEIQRQKSIKFHRVKRQMTPPGPPVRQLTWDAIQQIRYLKQEFPEEWTVDRLAEGFSVSRDNITRILKSKFIPPLERRAHQDARVLSTMDPLQLGHQPGHNRTGLPSGITAALNTPSSGTLTALPMKGQSVQQTGRKSMGHILPARPRGSHMLTAQQMGSHSGSNALTMQKTGSESGGHALTAEVPLHGRRQTPNSQAMLPFQHHVMKRSDQSMQEAASQAAQLQELEEDEGGKAEEEEDGWDGSILSDWELEELAETPPEQNNVVVRKGREFFDSRGNFLYRI